MTLVLNIQSKDEQKKVLKFYSYLRLFNYYPLEPS